MTSHNAAWFKKGSGTFVRSTLRAVSAKVPDPFLNHAGRWWFLLGLVLLAAHSEPATTFGQPPPGGGDGAAELLPAGALGRFGSLRGRHGSRILCLAFAPDGRTLLAGGGDDPLRLWDAASGRLLRTFDDTWVQALAFSPRGAVFASAGAFKVIRLWEMATGKEYAQLKGHGAAVKALAMSPDGSILASADQGGVIRLWDTQQGQGIAQWSGHADEINALVFAPDGKILASGSGDRSVRLWDANTGRPLRRLDVPAAVDALVFAGNGQKLIAGGNDNLLRSWETATGKTLPSLAGHQGTIVSLLLAADGRTLISGSHDRTIRFWDLERGREVRRITRQQGDSDALALAPDGQLLATAGLNNAIRLFDARNGLEIFWGQGHQAHVAALALSPDGKLLASGCSNASLRLWATTAGKETGRWQAEYHKDLVWAFAPDGQTSATAGGTDAVRFRRVAFGQVQSQLQGPADDPVLCLALSPDGRLAAVGHRRQLIRVWDRARNQVLHQLPYPRSVQAVGFSPDGKILAAAGTHQVSVYDLSTGREIRRLNSKEGQPAALADVVCLAFAADGKTLACGCYDGLIRLFDLATAKEIFSFEGHASAVFALAFSADGRLLVSGSFDQSVRLWEVFSGTPIAVRKGHRGAVSALALAPDGRVVYSGSADTTIVAWDVTGYQNPQGQMQLLQLEQAELQRAWLDLAAENTAVAHQALWQLVASSRQSVPFLANQLFLVDPGRIAQLLTDLNDNSFVVRERASSELARCGRWLEEVFQEGLQNPASEEVRRRLDKLLQRLNVPGTPTLLRERHRCRRAMLALEQLGTPAARQLLQNLAQRAPEPILREEAQTTLQRLARRQPAAAP